MRKGWPRVTQGGLFWGSARTPLFRCIPGKALELDGRMLRNRAAFGLVRDKRAGGGGSVRTLGTGSVPFDVERQEGGRLFRAVTTGFSGSRPDLRRPHRGRDVGCGGCLLTGSVLVGPRKGTCAGCPGEYELDWPAKISAGRGLEQRKEDRQLHAGRSDREGKSSAGREKEVSRIGRKRCGKPQPTNRLNITQTQ